MSPAEWLAASLAVLFVGISKAGFGGGTGILATPLMALVFPPRIALGVMLPLLIACDWVSIFLYRREWVWRPVWLFLPGCAAGILLGGFFLGTVDDVWLKRILGLICLAFCVVQWQRSRIKKAVAAHRPDWTSGSATGIAAGISSTLAHAAGPVFAMYLLPQRLPPGPFVATTVLAFTFVNLLKLPSYLLSDTITAETWRLSWMLSPLVVAGTWLGVWMNRRVPAEKFAQVIYILLFLSGLELVTGKSLLHTLLTWAT